MLDFTALMTAIQSLGTGIKNRLAGKVDSSEKGAPNGVASLDGSSHVPVEQIPSLDVNKLTTGVLPVERGGTGGFNMANRNIIISTAPPSGGQDGDVWLTYD